MSSGPGPGPTASVGGGLWGADKSGHPIQWGRGWGGGGQHMYQSATPIMLRFRCCTFFLYIRPVLSSSKALGLIARSLHPCCTVQSHDD